MCPLSCSTPLTGGTAAGLASNLPGTLCMDPSFNPKILMYELQFFVSMGTLLETVTINVFLQPG